MSTCVRRKAVRYKLKPHEIKILQEPDDSWIDLADIAHKLGIEDWPYKKCPCFCTDYGINDEYETDYFIDWVIAYEIDDYGEFELVRRLTDNESQKWLAKFREKFPQLDIDELRYIDYCYYNGGDSPSVWEIKEEL